MINYYAIQANFRTEMSAFLRSYFNNTNHSFDTDTVLFPQVDVTFDRPQIGAKLARPLIHVEIMTGRNLYRKAGNAGARAITKLPCRFIVWTADKGRIWDVNDRVQDLLELILTSAAHDLAARGIRVNRPLGNATKLIMDPSQEYQMSQRTVACHLQLEFKRAS